MNVLQSIGISPCEGNVDVVKQWLSAASQPWLMVIDNANDTSMKISRFCPAANVGSILITSRNDEICTLANIGHHKISPLSTEDAISLLLTITEHYCASNKEARRLALPVVDDLGQCTAFEGPIVMG